ncbi:hypothetical protein, partial [Aerococcus urinae]|uniref:hypothetical protein n=1 Tax=Aerococcus urinae TaxID=1376 RepID=UPI0034DF2BAA
MKFEKFVTISFAQVLYVLLMAWVVLLWVGGSLLIASGSAASASYEFSSAASGTGTFIGT